MLLKVEMDSYVTGKRSKKKFSKNFKVAEDLWGKLCKFADENDLCSRGKYSYNSNTLYLVKCDDLQQFLEKEMHSASEKQFLDDFRKQLFGANIIVEKTYVEYTFNRNVQKVDSFGFAYFLNKDKNRTFKVKLSDRVRDDVVAGDLVEITVLANKKMIVTDIIEKHRIDDQEELQKALDEFKILGGGY